MTFARPIALVGLMGAGKTTVARILGARLGGAVVDLDRAVEDSAGCTIAELFAREGEAGFRARESAALSAVLADPPAVLACGGGVILDPERRAWLRERCRVVWLEVSPAEAARRMGSGPGPGVRPLLGAGLPRLEAMLGERSALYAEAAGLRVSTDGRSPEQVTDAVLAGLAAIERRVSA
jgi:shikimate kinase